MAFINFPTPTPIFPTLPPLTWSVHKKAIMASRVSIAATGRTAQLACAIYPRMEFTLSYGGGNSWLRDQTQNIVPDTTLAGFTEFQQLSGLFLACLGSYGEFYYSDPSDNSRAGQVIGSGDGTTVSFPVYYQLAAAVYASAPFTVVGGINTLSAVYINGTVQSPSTYSIDATNTAIVFTSAPSAGVTISADFSFYYRCRFSDDTLKFSQFALNKWECPEVRFESVKP